MTRDESGVADRSARALRVIVLAVCVFAADRLFAQGEHEHMSLWSTEPGGGELAVEWDFGRDIQTFETFCISGDCLYSTINPALLLTGGEEPDDLYSLDDGTAVSLELVAKDAVATLRVNGESLDVGESGILGTAPDIHNHPSWQLRVPEGERNDYELSFRLTTNSPNYDDSVVYTTRLTNRLPPPTPTPVPPDCVGDCNSDGNVGIPELVLGVNIALGLADVGVCLRFDDDGNGEVSVAELVAAVNAALLGCVPPPAPVFAEIEEKIFAVSCAVAFCHDATTRAGGLSLAAEDAFDELVGVAVRNEAAAADGLRRVEPFDADGSFLVIKLEGPAERFGAAMPLVGDALGAEEIAAIRTWISSGAEP